RRIDSIASTGVTQYGPPYTGFFRPDSGGAPTIVPSSLSPFNGSNPNGQWILFVSDNAGADTGRVRQWSLIIEYGPPVGVGEEQGNVPNGFTLTQNYPNPFNPTTTIQFGLPVAANVTLKIYNVLGQEVATLVDGRQNAGTFQAVWNGRNPYGNQVASGMYFYSLVAKSADNNATFTNIKKMLLLK
ncbi:MAG: repeat protein, partial [Bacteroidetes bacterium]|nr:repeat protein [Bacteroidota bacterium]